ncbi:unnamed protein product, partial [Durusdinium trenchii]
MKGVQSNKALSSKAGEAEDSWVSEGDPWQNFKPTSHKSEEVVFTQNQQRPSQEARSRMSQMQQEIHDLKSQLEKTGTEDVHMTSSSLAQSSELQELRAQTKKHESWFAEQNNRMTSFETTLQAQGQQISQLNESMQYQSSATSALQHQTVEMQTSFKDQLTSSFDAQNARLEALLEKRRVSEVMQLPPGIWSFSETQLTEQGFRSFASQARHLAKEQGRQLRIHSGAAAPPRFLGSAAGAWTGALTMSDFPQQLVHPQWKGAEFESGRLLMNTVHIGGLTLTGSTLYGPANSPTWKQPLSLLSELIDTVTEEIVLGRSGLRYVAGDFNCDRMQLPQFHEWYRRGWRELQQVAYDRWQQPFQPTCKASTQRDFFWASPELLQRLQQVEVWHDLFPDHSVVVGHFDLARSLEPLYYWPMPDFRMNFRSFEQWHIDEICFAQIKGTFWLDDEQIEVEQSKQVDFPAQQ